jgi:pantetheine-phosphate adenylyltransferase/8-oxo-dGTP diphosphatase
MKQRKAVYAGSFDPLTNGHIWVIERAVTLFDELTIAIGINPDKSYFLSADERKANIEAVLKSLPHAECTISVEVIKNQYLAKFAEKVGASCLIRGIRSEGDFSYEYAMAQANKNLVPNIESIYLMPPPALAQVSSSLVKSLVGPEGWQDLVQAYVPEPVFQSINKKFKESL